MIRNSGVFARLNPAIDRDIMEKMEFKPEVSREVKRMPEIVFGAGGMERNDIEMWVTRMVD